MKKLNKKGFTLIELLAVLVILITILTIAIPSIAALVDRQKDKMLKEKEKFIEASAETFVNQYKNKITNYSSFKNGSCCIAVGALVDFGFLTNEDLSLDNDTELKGCIWLNSNSYEYNDEVPSDEDKCVIN